MPTPIKDNNEKIIVNLFIFSPSLFEMKSAKIGERLSNVQPIPIGKDLKTIC